MYILPVQILAGPGAGGAWADQRAGVPAHGVHDRPRPPHQPHLPQATAGWRTVWPGEMIAINKNTTIWAEF